MFNRRYYKRYKPQTKQIAPSLMPDPKMFVCATCHADFNLHDANLAVWYNINKGITEDYYTYEAKCPICGKSVSLKINEVPAHMMKQFKRRQDYEAEHGFF